MKLALLVPLAIGLAACGGAVDLATPTESSSTAAATATEIAPTSTEPGLPDGLSTPAGEDTPVLTPVGEPVTPGSKGSEFPVEAAIQDLAERLNLAPAAIKVESVEKVIWRDSSLGCPIPNVMYAQVLTEGYRIVLEGADQVYPYHTDTRGSLVLCRSGMPELPVIPINPGEIQDGQPWIPVESEEPEPQY